MNNQIIKEFENYLLLEKKHTKNTVNSYMLDIKTIFEIQENKYFLKWITSEDILENIIFKIKNKGKSNSTLKRIKSTINTFLKFLYNKKYIKNKIKLDIKINNNNKNEFTIFSKEEINKILIFDKKDFFDLRDKAIFELVYSIGIKATNCINLLKENLNLDIGYLKYTNNKNKSVITALNNDTVNSLKNYFEILETMKIQSDVIFVSEKGKKITRQGFWKIFKKRQKILNLDKELNPTTYRNSLAVHLLEDGISAENVKELLGLKDLNSLNIYINKIKKENSLKKIMINHPRNKMKE